MRIIFLDIDGVLNHQEWYTRSRIDTYRSNIGYPLSEIDTVAVSYLNQIVKETGAVIVISSTWRHSGIAYCRNVLSGAGLSNAEQVIVDITPDLSIKGEWVERGNEILKWRMDNKHYSYNEYQETNHSYVILDDDTDMLYQQRHNFFECSPLTGLTKQICNNIIQFFNQE